MTTPAFWTLISTAIGALTAILATFAVNIWSFQAQQKSLRSAFKGEVSAIVTLLIKRNYELGIVNAIAHMKEANVIRYFYFSNRRSFINVYEKNVDKIGMIGELSEHLIIFYSQVLAILEDNDALRELNQRQVEHSSASSPATAAQIQHSIQYHEQLLTLLRDTLERGKLLTQHLSS